MLLSNGADINAQDDHWRTPLILAAAHAQDANAVMRMLIDAGCDVDVIGFACRRALHLAASRGLDVDAILKAGADPCCPDEEGNQPLHYSAFEGNLSVTRSLLSFGCDPNCVNHDGKNSLHCAASQGKLDILELLVDAAGSRPTYIADPSGKTPLYYAAEQGHLHVVVYLIRRQCTLQDSDPPLEGAMHPLDPVPPALERKHLGIVRALVIGGYNDSAVCSWLRNPHDDKSIQGQLEHISWLQDFSCNPRNLGHLCRLAIRHYVGRDVATLLSRLPLPPALLEYVALNDLAAEDLVTSTDVCKPICDRLID